MKSKAHFKGHPIHPILVCFPLAFFIGTALFDVLALINDRPEFLFVAFYLELAGIIATLAAAVPGLIDYIYTIPPQSSAKKRGARHGLLNVGVLILFTIAWFYRQTSDTMMGIVLALELAGVTGLFFSGWMGGTLVYRNQIGVDPRYADAGKWKEIDVQEERGAIEVANSDELTTNQMKLIRLKNKRLVLAKTENGYVCFDDRCTHKGGSLAGGAMMCGTVQCPWHGSQFSVMTGEVTAGPAKEKINTYAVIEQNGKITITI